MTSQPPQPNFIPSDPNYLENPANGERMLFHTRPGDPVAGRDG